MPHEAISVFDMFKIGVGPSSSHTLGPWKAALRCLRNIEQNGGLNQVVELTCILYGSLAKTGKGHGTDIAVLMGLLGEDPETIDVNSIDAKTNDIVQNNSLHLGGRHHIHFDPKEHCCSFTTKRFPITPTA